MAITNFTNVAATTGNAHLTIAPILGLIESTIDRKSPILPYIYDEQLSAQFNGELGGRRKGDSLSIERDYQLETRDDDLVFDAANAEARTQGALTATLDRTETTIIRTTANERQFLEKAVNLTNPSSYRPMYDFVRRASQPINKRITQRTNTFVKNNCPLISLRGDYRSLTNAQISALTGVADPLDANNNQSTGAYGLVDDTRLRAAKAKIYSRGYMNRVKAFMRLDDSREMIQRPRDFQSDKYATFAQEGFHPGDMMYGSVDIAESPHVISHTVGNYNGTLTLNGAGQQSTYFDTRDTLTQTLSIAGVTNPVGVTPSSSNPVTVFAAGDILLIGGTQATSMQSSAQGVSKDVLGEPISVVVTQDAVIETAGVQNLDVTVCQPIITTGAQQNTYVSGNALAAGASVTVVGAANSIRHELLVLDKTAYKLFSQPLHIDSAGGFLTVQSPSTAQDSVVKLSYSQSSSFNTLETDVRIDCLWGIMAYNSPWTCVRVPFNPTSNHVL